MNLTEFANLFDLELYEQIKPIIQSASGSAVVELIKEKLKKKPKYSIVLDFYDRVNNAIIEASKETSINLPYKLDTCPNWLKSFFMWGYKPPEPIEYLPLFEPIENLRRAVENDLWTDGNSKEECDKFVKQFNQNINTISNNPKYQKIFNSYANDYKKYLLTKHLENIIRGEEFRMTADDPPLNSTYIDPNGAIFDSSAWKSFHNIGKGRPQSIISCIEKYFNEELYKNDYGSYPILFIGADFGIGKTSFIRMYASKLARQFISRGDCRIPIVYPLRECGDDLNRVERYMRDLGFENTQTYKTPFLIFLDGLDESGLVTSEHIDNVLRMIQHFYQRLPQNSQIIVTSRLILGQKGPIASYIKNKLKDKYIRLYGFNNPQIDNWFKLIGQHHSYEDAHNFNVNKLKKIGLDSQEYSKPLFLWVIARLIREGDLNSDEINSLGRTGLYLQFINRVSKEAKLKGTRHLMIDIERDKELFARHILHKISALRNLMPEEHGLDEKLLDECLIGKDKKIYEKLGGAKFIALSYFGLKEDHFEFTHRTFKEYLLAEYIIIRIMQLAATGEYIKNKSDLCIGEISNETAKFIKELLRYIFNLYDDKNDDKLHYRLLYPLFESAANIEICAPLNKELFVNNSITISKTFLKRIIHTTKELFVDDSPIIVTPLSKGSQSCENLGHHCIIFDTPNKVSPIYNERWIAFYVGGLVSLLFSLEKEFIDPDLFRSCSKSFSLYTPDSLLPKWFLLNMPTEFEKKFGVGISQKKSALTIGIEKLLDENSDYNLENKNVNEKSPDNDLNDEDFQNAVAEYIDENFEVLMSEYVTPEIIDEYVEPDILYGMMESYPEILIEYLSERSIDLNNANFQRSSLNDANMQYSSLLFSNLKYADLSYADLSNAILRNADLSNANLEGAKLNNKFLNDKKEDL